MCLNVLSSTSLLMSQLVQVSLVNSLDRWRCWCCWCCCCSFLGCLSEKYSRNEIQRGTDRGRSSMLDVWQDPQNLVHSITLWVQCQIAASSKFLWSYPTVVSQWTTSRLLILRSLIVTLFFVCWFYAVRLQSSSSFVDSTQLDRKALFCSLILRSSVAKLLFVWGVTKSKKFGALYYPSSMGFRFQSSLRFTSISMFLWLSNVQRYLMYSLYLLYPLYPVRGTKKAGVTLKLDCLKPKITPAWLLVADRVERS